MALAYQTHSFASGRPAVMATRLQFNSIGSGIDQVANAGASKLIYQAIKAGLLKKYMSHQWGREGEISICVQTNQNFNIHKNFSDALARLAVIRSHSSTNSTFFNPSVECDERSLDFVDQTQYGPFSETRRRPSLICEAEIAGPNPNLYHATLKIFENRYGKQLFVKGLFLQSAINARYAPLEFEANKLEVTKEGSLSYQGRQEKVMLVNMGPEHKFQYQAQFKGLKFNCK